jgi:hypothetical protein
MMFPFFSRISCIIWKNSGLVALGFFFLYFLYWSKFCPFNPNFDFGKKKNENDLGYRVAVGPQHFCFSQKLLNGDNYVHWGTIVVQTALYTEAPLWCRPSGHVLHFFSDTLKWAVFVNHQRVKMKTSMAFTFKLLEQTSYIPGDKSYCWCIECCLLSTLYR